MKRFLLVMCLLWLGVPAFAYQPPGGGLPTAGLEGFTSVDKLPPADQLPAAPLLIAAYAFVWLAVFFYVWTVARRMNKVEAEMHVLERRQTGRSGAR